MPLIISHRALGVQIFDHVRQKTVRNTRENSKEAVEYFIGDFHRKHTDMIEIDVRYLNGHLWVGHDGPEWKFDYTSFYTCSEIIVHCKNVEAVNWLQTRSVKPHFDFFFHDADQATFTKFGRLWVHPEFAIINPSSVPSQSYVVVNDAHPRSLSVEHIDMLKRSAAVCTDFPQELDQLLNDKS